MGKEEPDGALCDSLVALSVAISPSTNDPVYIALEEWARHATAYLIALRKQTAKDLAKLERDARQ